MYSIKKIITIYEYVSLGLEDNAKELQVSSNIIGKL